MAVAQALAHIPNVTGFVVWIRKPAVLNVHFVGLAAVPTVVLPLLATKTSGRMIHLEDSAMYLSSVTTGTSGTFTAGEMSPSAVSAALLSITEITQGVFDSSMAFYSA